MDLRPYRVRPYRVRPVPDLKVWVVDGPYSPGLQFQKEPFACEMRDPLNNAYEAGVRAVQRECRELLGVPHHISVPGP